MIELVLILLVGALGPVVGGALPYKHSSFAAIVLIGIILGYPLTGSWWALAGAVILYLGEKPGVGHPKGSIITGQDTGELEWWEPEVLRHHSYAAMSLRGAIFGVFSILVAYWQPMYLHLIPAFIIAMPLSMWLCLRMPEIKYMNPWRWSETLQYMIAAFLLVLIGIA